VLWGYNWATLFLGDINTEMKASRLGDEQNTTLFCIKIIAKLKKNEGWMVQILENLLRKAGHMVV
jgi:hypothetical protein